MLEREYYLANEDAPLPCRWVLTEEKVATRTRRFSSK